MPGFRRTHALLLATALGACARTPEAPGPVTDLGPGEAVLVRREGGPPPEAIPELTAYRDRAARALAAEPPVLVREGLDAVQAEAQRIALKDPGVAAYLRDPDGAPLRTEVFGVYALRPGDITEATEACRGAACQRVELYSFALNLGLSAVVDPGAGRVVQLTESPGSAPDVPPELAELAARIAAASPELAEALGRAPDPAEALMEGTKTALNRSRCERSRHLCVAPTFVEGEGALWAIVDLTAGELVGLRWTRVGATGPVTEKLVQNEVMRSVCGEATHLERGGWALDYMLTRSDGLKVEKVTYEGRPVLDSVKLVDWHVSYSDEEGFGYSDAVGCPEFSQAAVIAVEPPRVAPLVEDGREVGFSLEQVYWNELWPQPCNYSYSQAYHFYADGRFRPVASSRGRGCGDAGVYRPVTRIALAGAGDLGAWDGSAWQAWDEEGWRRQSEGAYTAEGDQLRFERQGGGGWLIAPSQGRWGDGGRGDDAYLYASLRRDEEGEADLITIGPCCNTDHRQGPERFVEPPEPIAGAELVLWYVAQLENDARPGQEYCWAKSEARPDGTYATTAYPCPSGPLFSPLAR